MEPSKVQLKARLSKDGARVLCGMPNCNGVLAEIDRQDLRQLKRDRPDLADLVPDEMVRVFIASGLMPHGDGTWRPSQYARNRSRRDQPVRDHKPHAFSNFLPHIVSGNATPEEHEAFVGQLRRRGGIPADRLLQGPTIAYCPKCEQRPNVIDPAILLTPPGASR